MAPARLSALASWSAVGWAATAIYGFATTAILFRQLGPAPYGIWATIAALKTFTTLLDSGLVFGVARDAARVSTDPGGTTSRIRAATTLSLLIGVGVIVFGFVFSWLPAAVLHLGVDESSVAGSVMVLVMLDAGLAVATTAWLATIRGLERFDVLAVVAVGQMILGLTLLALLVPAMGLIGAAVALVVARAVALVPGLAWLWRSNPGLVGYQFDRRTIAVVAGFAGPLWLINLGTVVGLGTDVPIVGAFFSTTAAAAFAVGSVVPAVSSRLLYAIVDSAYPRIAGSVGEDSGLVVGLIRVATMLGALGFGLVAIGAPTILEVWVGAADPLAVTVMRLYALTWALNIPAHVLVLQAIAASRHGVLAPIVLGEAAASFVLSVALAALGLPLGPALGTLATLAVSNLVVVPLLLVPRSGVSWRRLTRTAILGYLGGLFAAGAIWLPPWAAGLNGIIQLGATLVLGAAMWATFQVGFRGQRVTERIRRWPGRLWALTRHGGFRTYWRQRAEVRRMRRYLATQRRDQPIVWASSAPPLVTVRIATYDRGTLVRDRAIASALAQTHTNLEILVIGDQCDAATEAAVRSVRDPRVRFENLSRRGNYPAQPAHRWMVAGAAPMNRALEIARGDWIAPLDDDDEFTPDHVEILLDACRERELEFAYGQAEMEVVPGRWQLVGRWPLAEGAIVHAAVLYSARLKTMTHAIDSWRLKEPGDWNLWRRMRDAGVRMGFVERVVCRHYLERREIQ